MSTTNALYVQFTKSLIARCEAQGLEPQRDATTPSGLPENKGWCFLRFGQGATAALIIPKSVMRMGNCHVHIDCQGLEGYVPLPKENGRVICHFVPDLDLIMKNVVPRLPGASKRDVRPASRPPVVLPVSVEPTTPSEPAAPPEESAIAAFLADGEVELRGQA